MVKTEPEARVPCFVSFEVIIPVYEILRLNEGYLILFLRQNYRLPRILLVGTSILALHFVCVWGI